MIDDDLDKLLTDVDGNNEFSSARNQELRSNEKMVRKGDKNLGDDYAGNNSVKYAELLRKYKSDPNINIFDVGYINIYKPLVDIIQNIKKELGNINHPPEVMSALNKYRYDFLRYLENVEKYYNDFLTTQNSSALTRKAKQEFTQYFKTEDVNKNRIDFLILKEIFLRLREYNSFIKKEFDSFDSRVEVLNLIAEGKELYAKIKDYSTQAISYINKLEKFLQYIALLLSISAEDMDVLEKDILNRIYYRSSMDYDYSLIFEEKEKKIIQKDDDFYEEELPDISEKKKDPTVTFRNNINADAKKSITGVKNLTFTPPGLRSWNTKEPYVILIGDKYDQNIEDLTKTVHFIKEESEAQNINASIKKAMLRSYTNPIGDIVAEYEAFIYRLIIEINSQISKKFDVDGNDLNLLIYHMGPQTYYNIIKQYLKTSNLGLCFKVISENKLARFIPEDFIRTKILNWFEGNIHSLKLNFDSIEDFNQIKNLVKTIFKQEMLVAMEKINQASNVFYNKTGKHIDKNAMLKKKSPELFGKYMIPVYRRFVDKMPF